MILRDYQIKISKDAAEKLKLKKLVCLFLEVRTGKSLTALNTCKLVDAKKVMFITKIKAFSSIQWDYDNFGFTFDLTIIVPEFAEIFADLNHIFFGTAGDRRQVNKTMCLIGIFMIMNTHANLT